MKSRWVLVTGTSTGIGRAMVFALLAGGYSVIAGVRRQSDADSLPAAAGKSSASTARLLPILLDVTNADSIQAAFQLVQNEVAEDGLWGLISNAGVVVPGPVEHVSSADWRRQFDVNFFGPIELIKAMLPLLRRAVVTCGRDVPRVLLVSSIGARIAQPILAPYTSSKAAMSSLGESLRIELYRQGIGVTIVEPGAIATAIWGKGEVSSSEFGPDHPARALYGTEIDGVNKLAAKTAAAALSAERAADVILRAMHARSAPAKLLVGRDAKIMAIMKRWLRPMWFEAILRKEFGISRSPEPKAWEKPGSMIPGINGRILR
jgi:NAD(P)-dependent dehydrogenase (short-subunit alcohol dehydrogenase family)